MKQFRHHAWLSWPTPKKGGLAQVPTELFWTDVRFDEQKSWPAEGWTLVVKPTRLLEGGRLQVADIAFLVDDAPWELIRGGVRFELLDGTRVIAHGLIVDPANDGVVSREAVEEVLLV